MDIAGLIKALRVGSSVKNQTPIKWAGVAVTVALLGLSYAQSNGYLQGVSNEQAIEAVMALVLLYSQFATTDKIGLLPRERVDPERLRDNDMPTGDREPGEDQPGSSQPGKSGKSLFESFFGD